MVLECQMLMKCHSLEQDQCLDKLCSFIWGSPLYLTRLALTSLTWKLNLPGLSCPLLPTASNQKLDSGKTWEWVYTVWLVGIYIRVFRMSRSVCETQNCKNFAASRSGSVPLRCRYVWMSLGLKALCSAKKLIQKILISMSLIQLIPSMIHAIWLTWRVR